MEGGKGGRDFLRRLGSNQGPEAMGLLRTRSEIEGRSEYTALRAEWDELEFDPDALGHGRMAERNDLVAKALLGDRGIPIGYFEDSVIRYPRGASGLVYGPPGIGKDTTLIAHILADFGSATRPCATTPSLFIFDVAGESWWMSAKYREQKQGRPPDRIAPFRNDGIRYNPIQPLIDRHAAGKPLGLLKYEIAKGFVPPATNDHQGSWVRRKGINIVAELIHFDILQHGLYCTPGSIYDQLNGGAEALAKRFFAMQESGNAHLAEVARRHLFEIEHSPRELGFAVDEAAEYMSIYQKDSPLRAATAATDIRPADLKAAPRTVYFEIPGDMLYVSRQYVAAVMNSFIEGIAMAEGNIRTLFLANEFTQIGAIPSLRKALRLYRKYGVSFLFYAQSRAACEEIYGQDGRRDIEENCEFIAILGTDDPGLIKDISTWSGVETVQLRTQSLSGGASPSVSNQQAFQSRPVLQAENIRGLASDEMLMKFHNMAPMILAKRLHWKKVPHLRAALRDPSKMPGLVK